MSRREMFEHLSFEDWSEHLAAFIQDPDDEQRKDDRNAVNALWSIGPYITEGDIELPGFIGPGYSNEKVDDLDASLARIEDTKRKYIAKQKKLLEDGKLNRQTSDPADH